MGCSLVGVPSQTQTWNLKGTPQAEHVPLTGAGFQVPFLFWGGCPLEYQLGVGVAIVDVKETFLGLLREKPFQFFAGRGGGGGNSTSCDRPR